MDMDEMKNIAEQTLQEYVDYIIENDELKSDIYDFVLAKGQGSITKLKYMLDDVDMILFSRHYDFMEIQAQYIDNTIKEFTEKGWDLPIVKQWTLEEHLEFVKKHPGSKFSLPFNKLSEKQQNNRIEFAKATHKDIQYDREKLAGYDWEYHPVRILKECLTEELERLTGQKQAKTDTAKMPFSDQILNELEREKLIVKEPLRWVVAKSLLAYFVVGVCEKYNIKHGQNRKLKPFETLFGVTNLSNTINDIKKVATPPANYETINSILDLPKNFFNDNFLNDK
jgi:hypothetical protein